MPTPAPDVKRPAIPKTVWALGCVSLLMDLSSEMIHSLLPVFMVTVMGASGLVVGLIEGVAEATALIVKVFSGVLSDYFGKRKPLALWGYGLGAVAKPIFALASSVDVLFTARFIDRIGKGLRGAPRDALIADVTPPEIRGAAFGLRQSLDGVGAVLGPLLAVALMLLWANDFRAVFWVAVLPGALAVVVLLVGVKEPKGSRAAAPVNPLRKAHLRRLPRAFWGVVVLGAVFTLARFSEAFLVLRFAQAGLPLAYTPLVLVGMSAVYGLAAYPMGLWSDAINPRWLLAGGLLVLLTADMTLARANGWPGLVVGLALWGLHMAMTQGVLAAMVANTAPADLRGTAFGFFNLMSGLSLLVASVLAGWLWDTQGAAATFYAGAVFCAVALAIMAWRGLCGLRGLLATADSNR